MSATTKPRRRRTIQAQRLSDLLARRAAVGAQWAERTSHGLSGAGLLEELSILEHALTEGWPHLAQSWLTTWIVADAGRLHGGAQAQLDGCRYCEHAATQQAADDQVA